MANLHFKLQPPILLSVIEGTENIGLHIENLNTTESGQPNLHVLISPSNGSWIHSFHAHKTIRACSKINSILCHKIRPNKFG